MERKRREQAPVLTKELWSIRDVCDVLNLSRTQLHELDKEGAIPRPVYLGASKRYRRRELQDWIRLGMPSRHAWTWDGAFLARTVDALRLAQERRAELEQEITKLADILERGQQFVPVTTR